MAIRDTDKGYKRLLRNVSRAAGTRAVTVGVHEGAGSVSAGGGATIADVAAVHEFGLNGVERSFIRAWADTKKSDHIEIERKMALSIVRGINTPQAALEKMGTVLAADAQKFIQSGMVSPKTDKDGTTLIEKGQLVGSITHEVE
jgi:hypothetical protein